MSNDIDPVQAAQDKIEKNAQKYPADLVEGEELQVYGVLRRYFKFYSTELEGFTGIGHSVEDCIYKAKWGMKEHVQLLQEQGLPVPHCKSLACS